MRYLALLTFLAAGTSHAATLDISVTQDAGELAKYTYELSGDRQVLDLRDAHRYSVAVKDDLRKKEICRDAEYRTGLIITMRDFEPNADGLTPIEIVGQISNLETMENGAVIDCGVNQRPVLNNRAFSDTSLLAPGRTKVVVIDGKTTVLMTLNP